MSKSKLKQGTIFAIRLSNGKYALGQLLDQILPNVIRVALFRGVYQKDELTTAAKALDRKDVISLITCTIELLRNGVWESICIEKTRISKSDFPFQEQLSKNDFVGLVTYDAGLVEDFLEAFNGLQAWDDWYKPDYLDKWLISPSVKPKNLKYKKDFK